MSDPAHEKTDEIIKRLEKRIAQEFAQAEIEIEQTLAEYLKRFETKDKIWQKWVKEGKKTPQQYQEWKIGQLAIGKRWEEQKQAIAEMATHAAEIAKQIVNAEIPAVYAENYDFTAFDIERATTLDTSYTLINRDTVVAILKDRKIYHDPGLETSWRIAEGLEMRWNKEVVQSVMLQAILQGESIPKISKRLAKAVADKNYKASIRNARTMITGVENAARIDGFKRAQSMGIELQKQWLATLDSRTRHEHRLLDGEVVDVDEPFTVNGETIRYPGDPEAPGHLVYNCRCTLLSSIKGFENNVTDLANRRHKLGSMTYSEWKKAKAKSQKITHGEEVGEKARKRRIDEYRGFF